MSWRLEALTWNLPYRMVFFCEEFGGGKSAVLDLFRGGGTETLVQVRAPVRDAVELVNVVSELGFSVAFMSAPPVMRIPLFR